MARPSFAAVPHGAQSWDAIVDSNFDKIGATPAPLAEFANVGALPAAGAYDRCVAVVTDDGNGYAAIVISNGTTWKILGTQAAAQADSTATTVADLKTDFNALLAKLRASGAIDT